MPRGAAWHSLPHPVNEVAARTVVGMMVGLTVVIIVTDLRWLMFVLTYGFLARVLTGPTLSPTGLLATTAIAPKTIRRHEPMAGPPKRFAQTVGLVFSMTALVLAYAANSLVATRPC